MGVKNVSIYNLVEKKLDRFLEENKGNRLSTHMVEGLKKDLSNSVIAGERAYIDVIGKLKTDDSSEGEQIDK